MNIPARQRRTLVGAGIALALVIPALLSPFSQDEAALAAITAILVVSVVVVAG
jgi:hypothetical protein